MKKFRILLLFLSLFLLVGCNETVEEKEEVFDNSYEDTINNTGDYDIGESFDFMDFEITVGNVDSFVKIDNDLSNDNGKTVAKVPITVKNTGTTSDHLSMFYYKLYGPDGKELASKGEHFNDSIDYADDLEPNTKYTKYLYIPFSGNGGYVLEFNNFSSKVKIVIGLKK